PVESRSVEPWGLVSLRGRWYLVGHDRRRQDRRTFRLSRIVGDVKATGKAGAVSVPADLDLLAFVSRDAERITEPRTATLRVRPGRGAGLRREALSAVGVVAATDTDEGWDELTVPLRHVWELARGIAAGAPDVVAVDPPDLRHAVVQL